MSPSALTRSLLRLQLAVAVACAACCGVAQAATPSWSDLDGPVFSSNDYVAASGATFVGIDQSRHSLRFSTVPNLGFAEWDSPYDEFDQRTSINDFAPTPSGAAWVELSVDDTEIVGFERVTGGAGVLTPLSHPCGDDDTQTLLGVSADERLWVSCSQRVVTVATDGTLTTASCTSCAGGDVAVPAAGNGMWFVHSRRSEWDLRLVDQNGALVGSRTFRGPAPQEMVVAGDRLYWLRPQIGSKLYRISVIEGLSAIDWQKAAPVPYRRGLSARVGGGRSPAEPDFGSLVAPGDGSAWFRSDIFGRIVRVDPVGVLSEFAVGANTVASDGLLAAGGHVWAVAADQRIYRAALPGNVAPALPIVDQRPRIRLATRPGKTIALLSTLLQDSHDALPGTRISVKCLSKCRGREASGTVRGTTVRVHSNIVLYDGATIQTESSLAGYASTKQVFRFRHARGNNVRLQILRIDEIPFRSLAGTCGC